jgi:sec-independent protein translocase protein TatB
MFGIGYQEMFVVLVVALVVFGPQRLPELAGQVGRWVRQFRSMTADLTGEFEKTIAEVEDIKQTVRREMQGLMDEVEGVADSVKGDLSGKPKAKALGSGAASRPGAKKPTPAKPAATRPSANGKAAVLPKATKQDPLSDVSALDDVLLRGPVTMRSGGNGASAPPEDDALARVRKRRAAAAYSRSV